MSDESRPTILQPFVVQHLRPPFLNDTAHWSDWSGGPDEALMVGELAAQQKMHPNTPWRLVQRTITEKVIS